MEAAAAAVRSAEMLASEAAATVWAVQDRRVQRGVLQYETEHRRIGANIFEPVRVEAEAGRGELRLWRGGDATAAGTPTTEGTPTIEPFRTLKLDGAIVSLTKTPRKEQAHTFRVTVPAGGKHVFGSANVDVFGSANVDVLADWIATLTAEICLTALRPDERQGLISMQSFLLQRAAPPERVADGETALLLRSLWAWLPRSAWSANPERCQPAVQLARLRLVLALGPPQSEPTAAVWPSAGAGSYQK